ncbi:retrovirus-related pol polyprotein from transposon TNT 1-94 [Tanacetum coccineum]
MIMLSFPSLKLLKNGSHTLGIMEQLKQQELLKRSFFLQGEELRMEGYRNDERSLLHFKLLNQKAKRLELKLDEGRNQLPQRNTLCPKLRQPKVQATGGPTYLGVTSEGGVNPQLSSDELIYGNLLLMTPYLNNKASHAEMEVRFSSDEFNTSPDLISFDEVSKIIKLEDLLKLVHDVKTDFMELESLEDEPIIIKSIQNKTKTFDALPSLLNKVIEALNKFAQVIKSTLNKAGDHCVPSAGQANIKPVEGDKNTQQVTISQSTKLVLLTWGEQIKKDKVKQAMSLKDAEEEDTKSDSDDNTINMAGSMVDSSNKKKLRSLILSLKVSTLNGGIRGYGTDEVNFPRSTKRLKSSVKYKDHPAGTVLNEPVLGVILFNSFQRLHQGPGLDDHVRTFSSFLLAEVHKKNLNPLKQMKAIEQLRQELGDIVKSRVKYSGSGVGRRGNSQVKDNKIDLLVQQYEQFVISEDESIDSAFARFNTIITSLKALDEDNIKKDSEIVKAKVERKSLALKAKKESSDEECLTSGSEDEEYAMAVRDFKKFFKRRGRFVRHPRNDKKTFQRSRDGKMTKVKGSILDAGDPNHLIGECPKPPRDKNQRAFVGGSWRIVDENSSIDDLALDNEYDKLCKMSLKIITKKKRRFGHANMRLIQSLASKELVRNLPKLKFDQHFCDACKIGKQAHVSHKAKNIVSTTRCLELLHMDLFGPSAVWSYGGNHYTLVIVDDYSRYTWTRFYKDKTEAFDQFKIFSMKIQNQLGCTIVSIRTDHGREFDNEVQFGEFCNANGITHNFSAPRTPQSNGVVERKNRTLQEMSRTMLNEQSLPQKFWCNAVDTSTYILNRILIRAILGKTPYEILRGRKPTLDYFRVFGSKCFILNTKDYLTKFDPKSYEGVFLGYSQNSKAYIILNKHTRKIEESLNVTFDETPPPSKTSPLVDDDLDEEEAIREIEKKNLENVVEDETLEIDEIVNIKESRNHPLENVIGNLNQRTLRSQAQNQSNFYCFISTIEPKNVNEALGDESWIVAMQEELNQFIANDVWELVPQPKNMTIIGTKWVFRNKLDENGIVSRNKARLVAQGYNQQEGIDYDETYAPVARLESIRILLAYACALDFKLFQMDVKSAFLNGFINEEKFGLEGSKPMKTPTSSDTKLTKDEKCESVDSTKYRGMIGSLLYITASRLDIAVGVCLCARFQEAPKTSHLEAVKRIF